MPKENLKDFIIISHCFTCSKLYKFYNNISKSLVAYGYGVVRYDVMGLGDSEGDFGQSSFTTNLEDLISVYDYVSKEYKKPKFLLGHSLGSLVSIKAANLLDSIVGVATIGSPFNFQNLISLFSSYEDQLNKKDKIVVNLLGRDISFGIDYLNDLRSQNSNRFIKSFNKSIILFHSNSDKTVAYDQGLKLFDLIHADKSFITLNNVDHLVDQKEDSIYVADLLSTWLKKF